MGVAVRMAVLEALADASAEPVRFTCTILTV